MIDIVRQHAITRANVGPDLSRHVELLGNNGFELTMLCGGMSKAGLHIRKKIFIFVT